MKKLCCIFLGLILLISGITPVFATEKALPLSSGIEALRDEFTFGVSPTVNGFTLDYYAYSPVSKADDTNKYPLVVWLHGLVSGGYPGRQITKNDISYWVSEEFQSRFTNGGAYIFAPRSPEAVAAWDDSQIEPLKAAIDNFINEHIDYVDLSRIYIGGLSMGGKMTLKMVAAYPEMFAAAFPCSPYYSLTSDIAEGCADTPIWQLSSIEDCYMNYYLQIKPDWDALMAASHCRSQCRLSVFTTAIKPDGTTPGTTHDTWYAATYDMFMEDNSDYALMTTYDGNGLRQTLTYPNGMISWLCQHTSDYTIEKTDFGDSISSAFHRFVVRVREFLATLVQVLGLRGILG